MKNVIIIWSQKNCIYTEKMKFFEFVTIFWILKTATTTSAADFMSHLNFLFAEGIMI